MPFGVRVTGDGVAGWVLTILLQRAGLRVELVPTPKRILPTLLLPANAVQLFRNVLAVPDFLSGLPQVTQRMVRWGDGATQTFEHNGYVLGEDLLIAELAKLAAPSVALVQPDFRIQAQGDIPSETPRSAWQVDVELPADFAACVMEAVTEGWLFLLPGTKLLAVGDKPNHLLSQSQLIAPMLLRSGAAKGPFNVAPRLHDVLTGVKELRCGSAAATLDPISGGGTAYALREAILAAAVVRGIAEGGDANSLLAHYEDRVTASWDLHIKQARGYYANVSYGPWWEAQTRLFDKSIATAGLRVPKPIRYRLECDRLIPV